MTAVEYELNEVGGNVMIGLAKLIERMPRLNLTRSILVLLAVVAMALVPVGAFACQQSGTNGALAALTAALICWMSATLALVVTAVLPGHDVALASMLLGMMLRFGVPFACGLVLSRQGGPLAESGVFGFIVVFYLVTLAVETPLSLALLSARKQAVQTS